MGKAGYGPSSVQNIARTGTRGRVTTFYKRDVRGNGVVCNRCVQKFKAGEEGTQTSPGAYRHYPQCPGGVA
jgi:hypothetical protein